MDSIKIGKLIAKRRKELQMTQSQMAEKIGVTNKSISKWETGRCLPDASLWQPICRLLGISINELYFGELQGMNHGKIEEENKVKEPITTEDNKAIEGALLEIIGFHQTIKKSKNMLIGVALIIAGFLLALTADIRNLEQLMKGSIDKWDQFFVGLMSGMSTGLTVLGIILFVYGYSLFQNKVKK